MCSSTLTLVRRLKVLLATALVNVIDVSGEMRQLRVLLDQGAEASFICENAARSLQLHRNNERLHVEGLGGANAGHSTHSIDLCISDRFGNGFSIDVTAYVIPRINSQCKQVLANDNSCVSNGWPHTAGLVMADPNFMQPKTIHVLLGSDVYGRLLLSGVMNHAGLPTAQNTHLGWILSGSVHQPQQHLVNASSVFTHNASIDDKATHT